MLHAGAICHAAWIQGNDNNELGKLAGSISTKGTCESCIFFDILGIKYFSECIYLWMKR